MEGIHMDRVNIIMATYQGEKYIRQQLDSILESTYPDFVLSIYDDGSKDHTIEIIESYQKENPDKIQLYKNAKNMGHFRNFLQGVVDNPYDYVMFCDQDDVWKKDKIEVTYQCMKKAEAQQEGTCPIAVFTDATVVDETLRVTHDSFHQSGGLDTSKLDFPHMLMENKMMGCTMMLNRALIKKVTALPEQARFHDWWIALIAAAYGEIVYLPKATMLYRQHGHNVVGNTSFWHYVSNRIKNLKAQKKAISDTIGQAEAFYEMYQGSLPYQAKHQVKLFLSLKTAGFIKRRRIVLKNGFLKSGWTRNAGLMLIL